MGLGPRLVERWMTSRIEDISSLLVFRKIFVDYPELLYYVLYVVLFAKGVDDWSVVDSMLLDLHNEFETMLSFTLIVLCVLGFL